MTFPCYRDSVSLQVSFHTLYNLSLPETYLGQMKEVPRSSGDSVSLLMGEPQQNQACGYPVGVTAALTKAVMTVMLGGTRSTEPGCLGEPLCSILGSKKLKNQVKIMLSIYLNVFLSQVVCELLRPLEETAPK